MNLSVRAFAVSVLLISSFAAMEARAATAVTTPIILTAGACGPALGDDRAVTFSMPANPNKLIWQQTTITVEGRTLKVQETIPLDYAQNPMLHDGIAAAVKAAAERVADDLPSYFGGLTKFLQSILQVGVRFVETRTSVEGPQDRYQITFANNSFAYFFIDLNIAYNTRTQTYQLSSLSQRSEVQSAHGGLPRDFSFRGQLKPLKNTPPSLLEAPRDAAESNPTIDAEGQALAVKDQMLRMNAGRAMNVRYGNLPPAYQQDGTLLAGADLAVATALRVFQDEKDRSTNPAATATDPAFLQTGRADIQDIYLSFAGARGTVDFYDVQIYSTGHRLTSIRVSVEQNSRSKTFFIADEPTIDRGRSINGGAAYAYWQQLPQDAPQRPLNIGTSKFLTTRMALPLAYWKNIKLKKGAETAAIQGFERFLGQMKEERSSFADDPVVASGLVDSVRLNYVSSSEGTDHYEIIVKHSIGRGSEHEYRAPVSVIVDLETGDVTVVPVQTQAATATPPVAVAAPTTQTQPAQNPQQTFASLRRFSFEDNVAFQEARSDDLRWRLATTSRTGQTGVFISGTVNITIKQATRKLRLSIGVNERQAFQDDDRIRATLLEAAQGNPALLAQLQSSDGLEIARDSEETPSLIVSIPALDPTPETDRFLTNLFRLMSVPGAADQGSVATPAAPSSAQIEESVTALLAAHPALASWPVIHRSVWTGSSMLDEFRTSDVIWRGPGGVAGTWHLTVSALGRLTVVITPSTDKAGSSDYALNLIKKARQQASAPTAGEIRMFHSAFGLFDVPSTGKGLELMGQVMAGLHPDDGTYAPVGTAFAVGNLENFTRP